MATAALLVAAQLPTFLLLERRDQRHERLVDRLVREIVAVREDALVERASLLNRLARPEVLQSVAPTGQLVRALEVASGLPTSEEPDQEELQLVGSIADGAYE